MWLLRIRRDRFQRLVFPVREEKLDWGQCRMKTRIFAYLFDRSVSVFNERNNSTYRLMTQAGDGRVRKGSQLFSHTQDNVKKKEFDKKAKTRMWEYKVSVEGGRGL